MEQGNNITFDDYIECYKKLSIDEKRSKIIEEFKDLIVVSEKICSDMGIQHDLLINKEILDLKNNPLSEDDYLEALFVYVNTLKNSTGTYFDKMADIFYG